jgi:hypothetical protein
MDIQTQKAFVEAWHNSMLIGAILMITIGIIIFLVYHLKVSMIRGLKERHDYINANEIKWYKWIFVFMGIAAAMAINLYGKDEIGVAGVSFFVRLFFGLAGATLIIYIATLILDYYYPTLITCNTVTDLLSEATHRIVY